MTSGKSSVTNILSQALGWPRAGFSDQLRERLAAEGVDPTREALQDLGRKLVVEDPEGFCRSVLAMANFTPGTDLLLDGIRHVDIYGRIVRIVAPSVTMLIHLAVDDAELKVRGEARDRDGIAVLRADGHPVEAELKDAVPTRADVVIDARLPLDQVLVGCLDAIASNIGSGVVDAVRARAAELAHEPVQ